MRLTLAIACTLILGVAAPVVYAFAFVEGYQIRRISTAGQAMGEFGAFDIPQAITLGPDGSVYGTDGEPNRPAVQKFEPASGNLLAAWGDGFAPREKGKSADGEFRTPIAISVAGGKVFVVDGGNSRVQVFDESGTFLTNGARRRLVGSPWTGTATFISTVRARSKSGHRRVRHRFDLPPGAK
jgi:DNA-binding beta-propeller fold protein YncE